MCKECNDKKVVIDFVGWGASYKPCPKCNTQPPGTAWEKKKKILQAKMRAAYGN